MDLRRILREKIRQEVFQVIDSEWITLVYDAEAAAIIHPIFTRSDLLQYNIMLSLDIGEEREAWEYPAIYFVSCDSQVSSIINSEFSAKKYSAFFVCSLVQPEGLDPMIKYKVVHTNIRAIEERIFTCAPDQLRGLCGLVGTGICVNYLPNEQRLASDIAEEAASQDRAGEATTLILVNRKCDVFTPLLHFFTFKSVLAELKKDVSADDMLWPDLRYRHLAEIGAFLQGQANRLSRNVESLNSTKKVDMSALSQLAVEAPKNNKIKEEIMKYSEYLKEALKSLQDGSDLIEAEQILATDRDASNRPAKKGMDYFFNLLGSAKLSRLDKKRLLYLMKAKGLTVTRTEAEILRGNGLDAEDIEANVHRADHIALEQEEYKYDMSRYEPAIAGLLRRHAEKKAVFQRIGSESTGAVSLRKSAMITTSQRKTARRVWVLYMRGGLTVEETRIAYLLSNELGVELLVGADKIITPSEFIQQLRS